MITRYRPQKSLDQLAPSSKVPKLESRALTKSKPKPPTELAGFFADPPLVGDESQEDYENLFSEIAAAAKPEDAIVWILVREITDLAWECRRETRLKQQVIKNARKSVLTDLQMPEELDPFLDYADEIVSERDAEVQRVVEVMKQWETDPVARRKLEEEAAADGVDAAYILTEALCNVADDIDIIDRRISMYQKRRIELVREIGRYSESMARRLDKASSDIIDGEFTEAAE